MKKNNDTLLLISGAALVLFWPHGTPSTNLFSTLLAKFTPAAPGAAAAPGPAVIQTAPVPALVSAPVIPDPVQAVVIAPAAPASYTPNQYYDYSNDMTMQPLTQLAGVDTYREEW